MFSGQKHQGPLPGQAVSLLPGLSQPGPCCLGLLARSHLQPWSEGARSAAAPLCGTCRGAVPEHCQKRLPRAHSTGLREEMGKCCGHLVCHLAFTGGRGRVGAVLLTILSGE